MFRPLGTVIGIVGELLLHVCNSRKTFVKQNLEVKSVSTTTERKVGWFIDRYSTHRPMSIRKAVDFLLSHRPDVFRRQRLQDRFCDLPPQIVMFLT